MGKFERLFKLNSNIINAGGLLLSFIRYPQYLSYKKVIKRNSQLKNFKKSDKCYVCGLGPSLNNVNFSELDGDTIVVNKFITFDKQKEFKPTYYCMVDSMFLDPEHQHVLFEAINTYEESHFVLDSKYHSLLEKRTVNSDNLYYTCSWKGMYNSDSKLSFTGLLPVMTDVVCFSISLALYLGYKQIILLGCDFNAFASLKLIHCYEEDNAEKPVSLAFELFCNSIVANVHLELEKCARRIGVEIINATPNSLIDAYKRDNNYFEKSNI